MEEKNKTGRELTSEEYEKILAEELKKMEEEYENAKSPLWKKFNSYQKNLLNVQDVTERLLIYMKGHGISFKSEITDMKGHFSQEKLSAFVEDLLTRWEKKQRDGTYTDPSTGKSMAEPYIQARRELYGCYLYLVLRCSLWKGGYKLVSGGVEERTDFLFLLERAKTLLRAWCVMKAPDGSKKNELFWGYDYHFGLHFYRILYCPAAGYNNGFDLVGALPVDNPIFLTDEGNVRWNQFKSIYPSGRPGVFVEKAEEAEQSEEKGCNMEDSYEDENGNDIDGDHDIEDGSGSEDGNSSGDGYDEDSYDEDEYSEDDYDEDIDDVFGLDDKDYFEEQDALWYEEEQRQVQKQVDMEYLVFSFEQREEYVKKCERFVELFRKAGHDVLRGFCEDLEEIVTLYLVEKDIPPILDIDKALDVRSRINDDPCRQAARYARGIQWKKM